MFSPQPPHSPTSGAIGGIFMMNDNQRSCLPVRPRTVELPQTPIFCPFGAAQSLSLVSYKKAFYGH